jgi:hypothetical protein
LGIESTTVTLPAAWASALVNDDLSSLDHHEANLCGFAVRSLARAGLCVIDVARDPDTGDACEPRFTWHYRLHSQDPTASAPSGGDVLDYVVVAAGSIP